MSVNGITSNQATAAYSYSAAENVTVAFLLNRSSDLDSGECLRAESHL